MSWNDSLWYQIRLHDDDDYGLQGMPLLEEEKFGTVGVYNISVTRADERRWQVAKREDGWYILRTQASGPNSLLCTFVDGSTRTIYLSMARYDMIEDESWLWAFSDNGDGTYQLSNKEDGRSMRAKIENDFRNSQMPATMTNWGHDTFQKFRLDSVGVIEDRSFSKRNAPWYSAISAPLTKQLNEFSTNRQSTTSPLGLTTRCLSDGILSPRLTSVYIATMFLALSVSTLGIFFLLVQATRLVKRTDEKAAREQVPRGGQCLSMARVKQD